jgi:hypothetical protein
MAHGRPLPESSVLLTIYWASLTIASRNAFFGLRRHAQTNVTQAWPDRRAIGCQQVNREENCFDHRVYTVRSVARYRTPKQLDSQEFLPYILLPVHLLALDCGGVDPRPTLDVTGSGVNRTSCSTSRITMANNKAAESPHISTPVILSTGPKLRHIRGRSISP